MGSTQRLADPGAAHLVIDPAPIAMVWQGPDSPHQSIAVPGVTLAPGDALVEVELATICGSDIHTTLGHRSASTPLILGHEQVGRVVAVGRDARKADGTLLRLGDRVVWSVTVSCDECDTCRAGLPQKCRHLGKYGHERMHRGWELSGGFATHVHLRRGTAIVEVSAAMPAAVAAPAGCGTATAAAAFAAAAQIVDPKGQVALVTGAGLIGLTVTAMLTDAGSRVVVVDPSADRRGLALRFGAVQAVDPLAASASIEGVLAARGMGDGPAIAIEASGSIAAVELAVAVAGTGGVVILVGSVFPGPPLTLAPESVVRRHLTIRGVHNYAPDHLVMAVDYLQRRSMAYPFEKLVGVIRPLAEIDAALVEAAQGTHIRVGLRPEPQRLRARIV